MLLYVWPGIHGNNQNTVMKGVQLNVEPEYDASYLAAAIIVTVPLLIGVFGIRHIVASSHDSWMALRR